MRYDDYEIDLRIPNPKLDRILNPIEAATLEPESVTRELTELDAYENYNTKRVQIAFNPETNFWLVHEVNDDGSITPARFRVKKLEIYAVGVVEYKAQYAPEGTPSFVGTIARHATLPDSKSKSLRVHPFARSKIFVGDPNKGVVFSEGKRLRVDGPKMISRLR